MQRILQKNATLKYPFGKTGFSRRATPTSPGFVGLCTPSPQMIYF
jgi:hypothetical protein